VRNEEQHLRVTKNKEKPEISLIYGNKIIIAISIYD
jgi:hypothetical protein